MCLCVCSFFFFYLVKSGYTATQLTPTTTVKGRKHLFLCPHISLRLSCFFASGVKGEQEVVWEQHVRNSAAPNENQEQVLLFLKALRIPSIPRQAAGVRVLDVASGRCFKGRLIKREEMKIVLTPCIFSTFFQRVSSLLFHSTGVNLQDKRLKVLHHLKYL